MLRSSVWDERGSAPLEFLTAGIILLVPIAYLILTLAQVQQHALGAETAARVAAQELSRPTVDSATVPHLVVTVAERYGISEDSLQLDIACRPASGTCPAPGATVVVTVDAFVPLPFLSGTPFETLTTATVEGVAVAKVTRLPVTP